MTVFRIDPKLRTVEPDRDETALLEVKGITKSFGSNLVLEGIDFTLDHGQILALLGPSGCGKTTLLNILAGFLSFGRGDIRLHERSLTGVPAHRRDMPMMFQSYALFPHMTVAKNLRYGLRQRHIPRRQQDDRIAHVLDLVRLPEYGDRYPSELSGGQQQRVALARALVVEPSVVLLDEPLSNLDARLRQDMRDELTEILRRGNTTSILVTHDEEEAFAIADTILLLEHGRVCQQGSPEQIFEQPQTRFAAEFLGVETSYPGLWYGLRNATRSWIRIWAASHSRTMRPTPRARPPV